MTKSQESAKDKILNVAYSLFYREGFARVSVDAIAAGAGVTKRTVYYHFKSKDDIVADVLNNQHEYVLRRLKRWAGPEDTPIGLTIANLFDRLQEWADGRGYLGSGFTRISTELADRPGHPARKAASSHKAMTEKWLSDLARGSGLNEPEQIARQIMILIEGSMSLALIHGDSQYIRSAGAAARRLLATSN